MTAPIDHIVISVGADLDAAMRDYRDLGFSVIYGGVHASGATHNALIWLPDGTFIELMALTGEAAKPGEADYSPLLRGGEGLVGVCLRPADFMAEIAARQAAGDSVGAPLESGRLRPDGLRLAWRLALINGGYIPFLIEYLSPPDSQRVPSDPALTTHPNSITRLIAAEVAAQTVQVAGPVGLSLDVGKSRGVRFVG